MQSSILNYITSDKLPMFRKPQHQKQNGKKNEEYKLPTRETQIHANADDFIYQEILDTEQSSKKRKIVADDKEFDDIFYDYDFVYDSIDNYTQLGSPGNFKQGNDCPGTKHTAVSCTSLSSNSFTDVGYFM